MKKIISLILSFFDDIILYMIPSAGRGFISAVFIIAANLIPLFGVLFLEWDPVMLLIIYWAESIIAGLLNIVKMIMSSIFSEEGFKPAAFAGGLFLSVFFTFHYGMFMVVHGIFILVLSSLFMGKDYMNSGIFSDIIFSPGSTASQASVIEGAAADFILSDTGLAIAAILVSSLITFYLYFIRRREFIKLTPDKFMIRPYKRIIIMHLTIIFGACALLLTGTENTAMISVWIILKIIADLKGHVKEIRINSVI